MRDNAAVQGRYSLPAVIRESVAISTRPVGVSF